MADQNISLHSDDDWDAFVAANREALICEYGSLPDAYQRACQGGLTLGGGAAPLVHIAFVDAA